MLNLNTWAASMELLMMNQVPILIECGESSATDECLTEPPYLLVRWVGLQRDTGELDDKCTTRFQ